MAKNQKACVEITVTGRVQGVFFRRNSQKKANELKLTGYARNEANGNVFIHIEGNISPIMKFINWASIGEGKAIVETIQVTWLKPTGVYSSYEIINPLQSAIIGISNIVSHTSLLPKDTIVPKHIAIIPLGTRKWARNRNIDVLKGYDVAGQAIAELIEFLPKTNVKFITILALPQEIWNLPSIEIESVIKNVERWIDELLPAFQQNRIKFQTIGRKTRIPQSLKKKIIIAENKTRNNKALTFTLAIDYSGKDEIVSTFNEISTKGIPMIDIRTFDEYSDSRNIPEPDMLIVTGGRRYINDFLIWKIGKTYIEFKTEDFPDLTCKDIKEVILKYSEYQKAIRSKSK
ncbi:MAG TPA: polyprenyl diphosphate synthase [Candidatus Dojkabacteria bacterium]|nr:polyprenyl diphosphate synthase [Candidatus Dojkabacteria bacterium]